MKKSHWFMWLSLLVSLGLVLAACGAPPAPPPPTAAPDQLTPAAAPDQDQATPTLPPAQPMPTEAAPASSAPSSAAPTGLATTSWKLATVEAMGTSNAALSGTEITLAFSADGQVSGSAGCNDYTGSYQLAGNQLTIGPLATTQKMCEDPVMLQEEGYLTMLQAPAAADQQNDRLTLTLDGGATIFTYTPAGAAPTTAAPTTAAPASGAPGATPAPSAASPSNLANTNWKLTSVDAFGASNAPVGGVEITLNFGADNTVNGSAGCNNYNGPYQLNGDQLVIGALAATMKACPNEIMGQEAFYLATLQKPAQVTQAGNRLALTFDGGQEVFNYERVTTAAAVPAPAAGLSGTKWELRNLVDAAKQSKSSLLANTQITLIFGADDTLSGNDGCNQYGGTYQVNGNQLTVGPLIATQMACSSEIMQQESTYLIALQSATSFEQTAQQLTITHPGGQLKYAVLP